jgi:hypothetical protein
MNVECDTLTVVSRREITLREWWELRRNDWSGDQMPVSFHAVIQARKLHRHDFPTPAKITPPNTAYYYMTDLDAWKRRHPGLFQSARSRPATKPSLDTAWRIKG